MGQRITSEAFFSKCIKKHNNQFDYSKSEFLGTELPLTYICPKHGEITQNANNHSMGIGCPKCSKESQARKKTLTQEVFIARCKHHHGDLYDYTNTVYTKKENKITYGCPVHGEVTQTANPHMRGAGCRKCYYMRVGKTLRITHTKFLAMSKEVHGDTYKYLNEYITGKTVLNILCPVHGEFKQLGRDHLKGNGCPKCGAAKAHASHRYDTEIFVKKVTKIHNNKYKYPDTQYVGAKKNVSVFCDIHGEFSQMASTHINGHGCPKCKPNNIYSKPEEVIARYLSKYTKVIQNDRTIIGGKELDIYLPELALAIEFNGLFFHSTNSLDIRKLSLADRHKYSSIRHLEKSKKAAEKGIRLIHIYEDEYTVHRKALISFLKNLVQQTKVLQARKLIVGKVLVTDAKSKKEEILQFLDTYHLQGRVGATVFYTLRNTEGELVSCLGFSFSKSQGWILNRAASSSSVTGGFSRLFKAFIRDYNPSVIITYCEDRCFSGGLYNRLGFVKTKINKPEYWAVFRNKRYHRRWVAKKNLTKLFPNELNLSKTQNELCDQKGIGIIYGCGISTWVWTKKTA